MKYLALQQYLLKNSPEKLKEEYAISFKTHSKYPSLHLFKYNQIESPMHELLVQVSRGIILDKDDNWKVVCYGYDKFFNAGEVHAAKIDWQNAKVYEKLDGSLIQMYWYDNQWQIATSGSPDAGGDVNGLKITFNDLFWKVWKELDYTLPNNPGRYQQNVCYLFELMTPYNRIVVPHKTNKIVLHGARNLENFSEIYPFVVGEQYGWQYVKSLPLDEFKEENDITKLAADIDPMQSEGFVVVDDKWNRLKVKAPKYVALHHAIDGISPRRMLEILQKNESDEFLAYFPEWTELYQKVKDRVAKLAADTAAEYDKVKDIAVQKDFALAVRDLPVRSALFAVRSKKYSTFEEYFLGMNIKNLEELLNLKDLL